MSPAAPEPASFRDPDAAVFRLDGRVLRGLNHRAAADWDRLAASAFFHRLVAEGRIVGTRALDGAALAGSTNPRGAPWSRVLEHEVVPVMTYPFEWPFAMLQDAAICHLEVLLAALEEGITTKDGTAYNVAFVGRRPVFLDIGSFTPAAGPWPGYRQFCQTFLFPLLVQAHLGIAYQGLLRGRLDGLEPTEVRAMFGGVHRFGRGVFRHVYLHSVAERRVTASSEAVKEDLGQAGFGAELAKATVTNTLRLVRRLGVGARSASAWSDYRTTCSYTDADASAKEAFVSTALEAEPPRLVLDLGANDGAYSILAARTAEQVVAVDGDEAVIDALYRRLGEEGIDNVLPLVVDLTDPSPGLGWANRERRAFSERVRPDLVLSLALVHHLALAANVPLPLVVDWLRAFDARVIVEFVDRSDPMVQRLLANKPAGLFEDYQPERFASLLAGRFAIREQQQLPGGTRTLYLAEPA